LNISDIGRGINKFRERVLNGILDNKKIARQKPSRTDKKILEKQLDYSAGIDWLYQNPDDFMRDKGHTLRYYDTMMMDDKISGTIDLKKKLALSVPWSIIPSSDEEKDEQTAEFVRDQLLNLKTPFVDIMHNQLDSMVYGVKVGEKRFSLSDDKSYIKLDDIHHMHSIFFDFGYDFYGDLEKLSIGRYYGGLFKSESEIKGRDKIQKKFDVFVYPYLKDGNYYGTSDLMNVYTQYNEKFWIIRWRGKFLQNYGMPFPEVIYDSERTKPGEKTALEEFMENWQDSVYMLNPGRWSEDKNELVGKFKFEFHNFDMKSTDAYEKAIDQLDKQIQRKLLVPDKTGFTEDKGGSYNLGEHQFNMLTVIISDLHRMLEDSWNKTIRQIIDLNFPTVDEYPIFKFDRITDTIEAQMLQILVDKGIVDKREGWIRNFTNIPELSPKEKEEIEEAKEEDRKQAIKDFKERGPQLTLPFDKDAKDKNDKKLKPEPDKMASSESVVIELQSPANPFEHEAAREDLNRDQADFLAEFKTIMNANINHVGKQIERKKIVETGTLAKAKELKIKKQELNKLIFKYFAKTYFQSKKRALKDIIPRLNKVELKKDESAENEFITLQFGDNWIDREWIDNYIKEVGGTLSKEDLTALKNMRAQAFEITGNIEAETIKNAWFQIDQGIKNGWTTRQVVDKMDDLVTQKGRAVATTIARTNATSYFNNARHNLFMSDDVKPFVETFIYTAVMDDATTDFCRSHDGQIIKSSDSTFAFIQPPNHFNCRSTLEPIFQGEAEDQNSFFYKYDEAEITVNGRKTKKHPEWGSRHNSDGQTFNMGDPKVSKPAEGFGK
jgi:SPP1 gp7 family putative phage head morphogenesis protein